VQQASSTLLMSTGTGSQSFSPCRSTSNARIDLHDLAVVAERREEPAIEFSEFRKRYEQ